MPSIAFAIPILPGKTEQGYRFAGEVYGPRLEEFREHQRRFGVSRESWYLQKTPASDFILVYFAARDIAAVFRDFAALRGFMICSPKRGPTLLGTCCFLQGSRSKP